MPTLHYPKPMRYTDRKRDREYIGPGRFSVPADAVDEYTDHGWEHVDYDDDTAAEPETETRTVVEGADGPTTDAEPEEDTTHMGDDSESATGAEGDESGDEVCGATLSAGGTCDRLVSECPYPSHRTED